MKTQACKGAVCYIDLLGFSYLTEKLDSTVLYTNPDEEKPFGEKKIKELRICDLRQLDDYIKKVIIYLKIIQLSLTGHTILLIQILRNFTKL